MYLWRRTAELHWIKAHEDLLQAHADGQLVIVRRPGRKRLELEIVCRSRSDSSRLVEEFGGRVDALPRNWLERFTRVDFKPIKIGKRLTIVRSINELQRCRVRCPQRNSEHYARANARTAHSTAHTIEARLLVIPASLAFGTGKHATTAMSLRFLEQLTRDWKPGWSLVDLGTGSGILALAARRFGGRRVVGVDNDPTAISMAKSNAGLNKIRGTRFQIGDVHKFNPATGNGCNYREFILRFAYRDPAETSLWRLANSLRHFKKPGRRIGSRAAAEPLRHHPCETSREMGGHSGEMNRHGWPPDLGVGKFLRWS